MSIQLTGKKERPIGVLQERLDNLSGSCNSYEQVQTQLSDLAKQNCELADIPAREDRIQALLSQSQQHAQQLKIDAEKVNKKTDAHHIRKYFKLRDGPVHDPSSYRYMNWNHKKPLQHIYQITNQILATDYEAHVSQLQKESEQRKREALAALEFSSIDQTFPSVEGRLIMENSAEYLRQSLLYQHKLLQKGDLATALDFGKSWIKNPPKEATWEDVEHMSFSLLEAAKETNDIDLTESRAAIEQWLAKHPLPESSASAPLTPSDTTIPLAQETYVLGLFYLHARDLSPSAFRLYQGCGVLYPNQHHWKAMQAFCYISEFQWVEAKQVLVDLPIEDPAVKEAQKCLAERRRERICLAGLDLGILAFPQLTPHLIERRWPLISFIQPCKWAPVSLPEKYSFFTCSKNLFLSLLCFQVALPYQQILSIVFFETVVFHSAFNKEKFLEVVQSEQQTQLG